MALAPALVAAAAVVAALGAFAAQPAPTAPAAPSGATVRVASSPRRPAFRWPLSPVPEVVRRFAVGPHPWSPGHRGVDLAAADAQPVLAAGAGVVSFAGVVAGRGVVAVLHAGGLRTTYEPVTPAVRAGDAVAAGAPLGPLAPGTHCPRACLHWGALRGETYLDPLTLLRPPAPPVLLPLP